MMNELNLMKYKDYFTRVYVDMEEHTLFGRLEGITDLVTWATEGTLVDAETEFHAAVDDYLEFFREISHKRLTYLNSCYIIKSQNTKSCK